MIFRLALSLELRSSHPISVSNPALARVKRHTSEFVQVQVGAQTGPAGPQAASPGPRAREPGVTLLRHHCVAVTFKFKLSLNDISEINPQASSFHPVSGGLYSCLAPAFKLTIVTRILLIKYGAQAPTRQSRHVCFCWLSCIVGMTVYFGLTDRDSCEEDRAGSFS
jgi:hypothetical protein